MKEVFSKAKDCQWLAQQIKNQMGRFVSFNEFGLDNYLLTGVYSKNGTGGPYYGKEDVRFYIKFCKNDFLRIQIDLGCNSNESIALAMNRLILALSNIKQGDTSIGFPLAVYEINGCLTTEYAFKTQEKTIEDLKNNTMFDDGHIENLVFFKNCNNCSYGSYAYEGELGKEPLYCTYGGGCDTQTSENETCINHEFEDGEIPDIQVLCKSIWNNKQ